MAFLTNKERVMNALRTPASADALLRLVSELEKADLVGARIRLEVSTPRVMPREYVGELFGMVDIFVTERPQ